MINIRFFTEFQNDLQINNQKLVNIFSIDNFLTIRFIKMDILNLF